MFLRNSLVVILIFLIFFKSSFSQHEKEVVENEGSLSRQKRALLFPQFTVLQVRLFMNY